MANTAEKKGVINSWTLVEFRNEFGKMKITDEFTNSVTGERFRSCAFEDPATKKITLVGFSSNLGELKKEEIIARHKELQVVELPPVRDDMRNFKLCARGNSSWEDVDF